MTRLLNLSPALLLLTVLIIAGLGCTGQERGANAGEVASAAKPDASLANPEFPAFVYNSALALKAYKLAVKQKDVLASIPCYCDCGRASKHTSLKDCYYKSDGTFNDHASNCDVCEQEIIDVDQWRDQGIGLKEVRTMIDEKYRDWGEPTNTPPIE